MAALGRCGGGGHARSRALPTDAQARDAFWWLPLWNLGCGGTTGRCQGFPLAPAAGRLPRGVYVHGSQHTPSHTHRHSPAATVFRLCFEAAVSATMSQAPPTAAHVAGRRTTARRHDVGRRDGAAHPHSCSREPPPRHTRTDSDTRHTHHEKVSSCKKPRISQR